MIRSYFLYTYTVFILSEVEPSAMKSHLSETDGHTYCDEHNLLCFCV